MKNNISRAELEKRIVALGEAVDLTKPNSGWLEDDNFRAFLDAWNSLKQFYGEHTDTIIGIEVLREYVDYARLLRRMLSDDNLSKEIRQKARDALEGLEYYIDEIIRSGVTNQENQKRL